MGLIEKALFTVCGVSLRVKLEIVEGLASVRDKEEAVEETPFLKSALDLFKGKVIKRT